MLVDVDTAFAPVADRTPLATPVRDRRDAVRTEVELSGLWRPVGSPDAPSLVLFLDLSTRGARIAGWIPYTLEVGDRVELRIAGRHAVEATVARVLGDGEYGVRFDRRSDQLRDLLAGTVGRARAGVRHLWAVA